MGWAGNSPTLGTCGFYDTGSDDSSASCQAVWNSADIRLTASAGTVTLAATTGTEGLMFLITTDSSVPIGDGQSYFDASIDSVTEDSSKIAILGPTSAPSTTIQRYRSVGINTGDLNTLSRKVTISGNTAVFSGPMPNNIGVGDVLQYQNGATYLLAFIHGRGNANAYTVYTSAGAAPTATTSASVNVYRAYTNLFNWEAQDENDTLNDTVENFDTSTDLTAGGGTVMNVAAYGDGADTTAVTISGWTTSASNYIRIYTATSTSEVGASQRHNGKWDASKI